MLATLPDIFNKSLSNSGIGQCHLKSHGSLRRTRCFFFFFFSFSLDRSPLTPDSRTKILGLS